MIRIEYNDMIVAIESEASALTRLYNAMERQGGEELSDTKKQIIEYIRFVVEDQWPALRELKIRPRDRELLGRTALDRVWKDLKRCLLVSLYSSMVAVVLLGIFILTHPYSYAAGVNPDVFQWLLDASSG